jgi:hypothetical protein
MELLPPIRIFGSYFFSPLGVMSCRRPRILNGTAKTRENLLPCDNSMGLKWYLDLRRQQFHQHAVILMIPLMHVSFLYVFLIAFI